MYRKVSLSSFHNGKVEYCAILGSGDIEENASVIFFYSDFIWNIKQDSGGAIDENYQNSFE